MNSRAKDHNSLKGKLLLTKKLCCIHQINNIRCYHDLCEFDGKLTTPESVDCC